MKRQLLREFIREALLEADVSVEEPNTTAQGSFAPSETVDEDWAKLIATAKDYSSDVNTFITGRHSDIRDAADAYRGVGYRKLKPIDGSAKLKPLIYEAVLIDLKYGKGDKIFPLALVTLCSKIDNSWDNLWQLLRAIGNYIWGTIGSYVSSWLGESTRVNEAPQVVAGVAAGVAIAAVVAIGLYAFSAVIDSVLPAWIGTHESKDVKGLLADVYEQSAVSLENVGSYFQRWTDQSEIGDDLAALASAIRSTGATKTKLEELKTKTKAPS